MQTEVKMQTAVYVLSLPFGRASRVEGRGLPVEGEGNMSIKIINQ